MKRILLLLVVAGFTLTQLSAQEPTFVKGDKVLNLGVGLGSNLYSGSYYHSQIPPVSASFEVGVADKILEKGVIGVGGYLGFSSYKYTYANSGWKTSNIIIGARGNFHYPLVEKLDTYTGLLLGYGIVNNKFFGAYNEGDYGGSSSGIQWAWFVGGRYYFKENLAAMLELGYGVAYLNLGIALKF
jgi:hypothetical protein